MVPPPPGVGLALGEDGYRRIIPMKSFGRHDMAFHKATERIERHADRPHGVGHGRSRDRHAFQSIAFGLTIQGLMLTELLEHDHSQEAGPRPSPRDDMERCRRLCDLLAVATGELFPDRLDHFPPTGLRFQGSRHVLAEFAQAVDHQPLPRRRGYENPQCPGTVYGGYSVLCGWLS